ncbi:MAG TPA: glycosyl hydrolase-related protein, partial [Tepidisphaeraceae bacterium]|nr:glycosyl hydrolase-related protein [Tepidisphaeraceae bacterium]
SIDTPAVVIDTVKKAEDSQETIIRLYESHGSRGTARLRVGFPIKSARFCNLLEDKSAVARVDDGKIEVPFGPYQIITICVR